MATLCGWCGAMTSIEQCSSCQRDPALPYLQRATKPPLVRTDARGRPGLTVHEVRRRLATAAAQLAEEHRSATVDALATQLDVSPKTIRRWRQMVAGK